ncbi:MAG: AAA family ATPase [Myxococcales bacterium]|nr:AAA family ATPase [Myxococcales bacterium]
MVLHQADDVQRISAAAMDLARGAGRPVSSVHLLLAMFVTPCAARDLLAEVGAHHGSVLDSYRRLTVRDEPAHVLQQVWVSADGLGDSSGAHQVDSACLLAGLLRVRRALAARVMREAGIDVTHLRARVIGHLTLDLDRAGSRRGRTRAPSRTPDHDPAPARPTPRALPLPTGLVRAVEAREAGTPRRRARWSPDAPADVQAPGALLSHRAGRRASRQNARPVRPAHDGGRVTSPNQATVRPPTGSASSNLETPVSRIPSPPVGQPGDTAVTPPKSTAVAPPSSEKPGDSASKLPRRPPHRGVFDVDPAHYPVLSELGRNLTHAALDGEIQPLIGRHDLVDAIIDVLMMRQVNNPCLVGEAGVGKTAIVEGLARRLAGNSSAYGRLGEAVIIEISVSGLLAGTSFRGAFSQRMKALRDEVAKADGRVIVFMDEIHTIMGAGAGDGPLDAANDLKTALSRGRFPLIGATTIAEYRRHVEKDPAMERRFQVVSVPEPSVEEAITILGGVAPIYASHHGLSYSHDAVVSSVQLSKRFITDRCLPDKAIAVLDRAGAQARRRGKTRVEADDVSRAVHQLTQVPLDRLLADERSRIRDLGEQLKARIFGHDAALTAMARRVKRNYAGFAGDRPLASFLLVGTPGTGKTAAAAALAETLFLVDDALVRFDMNEYTDSHSISRLIGSPPGYVGHQQPGLLSQAMHKRPYRVLLFDDVDRAASEIVALLLQIVDTGRITDNQGQVLDLRNAIVIMTSTVGVSTLQASSRPGIGFTAAAKEDVSDEIVLDRVRKELGPELWGRVDDKVLFRPLSTSTLRLVTTRTIEASLQRLYESRLVRVHVGSTVIDLVLDSGGVDAELGVRPLRARVESLVEAFLADCVLEGQLQPGSEMRLEVSDGKLTLMAAVARLTADNAENAGEQAVSSGALRSDPEHAQTMVGLSHATAPTHTSARERP